MKKIYHHCDNLEETPMWGSITDGDKEGAIARAYHLMKDVPRFKKAMMLALKKWPTSCEHNLTAQNTNRKAWLGHAGNYLCVGTTEDLTRLGWHRLDQREQDAANEAAQEVILVWEQNELERLKCQSAQLELMF